MKGMPVRVGICIRVEPHYMGAGLFISERWAASLGNSVRSGIIIWYSGVLHLDWTTSGCERICCDDLDRIIMNIVVCEYCLTCD